MGTALPDQPSKSLTAPSVTRAAIVHSGHDNGSVEQQARNAPIAHRTKCAGDLAATRFSEDATGKQQSGHSNEPHIRGFHHIFETALSGATLQGAGGLTDIDHLLQPLVLVTTAMHDSNEQQRFGGLRRCGNRRYGNDIT